MDRLIDVPGGRIFATDEGAGPPVVLVHAAIVDLRSWNAVVPGLARAGYRVIRYDQRTSGRSVAANVKYSDRADLLAVLDAFEVGRAAVVGSSRGGYLAIDTAIEFPERIRAVVGVAAEPSGFVGSDTPLEAAFFEDGEAFAATTPPDPEAIVDLLLRLWVDGPGQPPTRVRSSIRAFVGEMARPLFLPGRLSPRRVLLEPPANDRLWQLSCPVLALAGSLDLSSIVAAAHRLEEAAPHCRAVVWPNVGHMIGMEQPERLATLVADFLSPLQPWS